MFVIVAMAAAMASASPEVKIFGDWAVACDNGKRCEAVALINEERQGDEPTQALIRREAGPNGEVTVQVWPPEARGGSAELQVDGKTIERTGLTDDGAGVSGEAAIRLARAMAQGQWLQLKGATAPAVSLKGMAATLRYIDAEQGRVGNVSAFVATGSAPASAVPAAPALPIVAAVRAPAGTAKVPDALASGMAARGECEPETWLPDLGPEYWPLGEGAVLALIPCGSGAYNFNSAVFVVRDGKAEPAPFDTAPDWMEGGAVPIVTNAQWDGGVLVNFAKGRGLGDCGVLQHWVWDGARFRMVLGQHMEECRGAIEWPTLFRAEPVFR